MYQANAEKKVQHSATFAHLLQQFDTAAVRVRATNGLFDHHYNERIVLVCQIVVENVVVFLK